MSSPALFRRPPPSPWAFVAPALTGLVVSCAFNTHGTSDAPPADGTTTTSAGTSTTTSGTTTSSSTTSSTTTTTSSSTTSSSGTGGSVGAPVVCGDGQVDAAEGCDDGNTNGSDGCAPGCTVELGFLCAGEPSACTLIPPQVVTVSPNLTIKDPNLGYDGTLGKMQCASLQLVDQGFPSIHSVVLTVGIDHPWVGDLVLKLVSPAGTISTMMSRPGLGEPNDAYDEDNGDSSKLTATSPLTFRDDATDDAETMGSTIDSGVVCQDDARCVYRPNPGSGPGQGLSDFQGESPAGDWRVCLADGDDTDQGTLKLATLSVVAWPAAAP